MRPREYKFKWISCLLIVLLIAKRVSHPFLYWASQHKTHHIFVLGFPIHDVLGALYQGPHSPVLGFPTHQATCPLINTTPIIVHIAQIMSVSFAKFFSATSRISSLPINHTHGRASIVDGAIIYSPNCSLIDGSFTTFLYWVSQCIRSLSVIITLTLLYQRRVSS